MRKIIFVLIFISAFEFIVGKESKPSNRIMSGTPLIESNLGYDNFVDGLSPLINQFTTNNEPSGTQIVAFTFFDENKNVKTLQLGAKSGSHWFTEFDMGKLAGIRYIRAYFLTISKDTLGISDWYQINSIIKPTWLNDAKISNFSTKDRIVSFQADLPVKAIVNDVIPGFMQAIDNRSYGVDRVNISYKVSYDIINRKSIVTQPKLVFGLNILDQSYNIWEMGLGDGSEFNVDSNFILFVKCQKEGISKQFKVNFPGLTFPIVPAVTIKVDAGLKLLLSVKGTIVVGNDNNQWGFIRVGNDVTGITAKISGDAYIRGKLNLLYGIASASGSLIVSGQIGGGFEYTSTPENKVSTIFGGEISVSGRLAIESFWGFGPDYVYSKEFYSDRFGNFPGVTVKDFKDNYYGILAKTNKLNISLVPPDNFPQPCISSNGNYQNIVWLESYNKTGYLLISSFSKALKRYYEPIVVMTNNFSISNPKVATFSNGSAIVTWSQNRYNEQTIPSNYSVNDLLSSQDIWCAIYDHSLKKITHTWKISEDAFKGRGEASVSINNSNIAVVNWVTKNNDESQIYSRKVYRQNDNWYQSNLKYVSNNYEVNRDVEVTSFDGEKTVALWISESGDYEDTDNEILMNSFDGDDWDVESTLMKKNPGYQRNDLTVGINGNYGGLGWIATTYNKNGTFLYNLNAKFWDTRTGKWIGSSNALDVYDSLNCIEQPKMSISDNGIAAFLFKSYPMFTDVNEYIPSNIYLLLKDIKNANSNWKAYIVVPDSNATVWDLDMSVNGNVIYVITQEKDSILGKDYQPSDAVRFGSKRTELYLRTYKINDDLTLEQVFDIKTPNGILSETQEVNIELSQNYPNPFSSISTIEFKLPYDSQIKLEIFDIFGNKLATIIDDYLSNGIYQTSINAESLNSGFYFYKLTSNKETITKSIRILK